MMCKWCSALHLLLHVHFQQQRNRNVPPRPGGRRLHDAHQCVGLGVHGDPFVLNRKDFAAKLPYGNWIEAKAEDLPDKKEFLSYFNGVLGKAEKVLPTLNDDALTSPIEAERAWLGTSQMGLHLYMMRELSDHTGELNKMLIEDSKQDVWISK